MKQLLSVATLSILFVIMLVFPQETFRGASNGLLLWYQTIIPTLLPFIIMSNLLIQSNAVYYISRILTPFIKKLFCVSDYSCYAIIVGLLCGYPMGAKVIADLVTSGYIQKNEGQYLLSFCNNTSPMFIISFIVLQSLRKPEFIFPTLLILFVSPIFCSFIFRTYYKNKIVSERPSRSAKKELHFNFCIFDTCIMNGFETITKVGGYIILFSIFFSLCRNLPMNHFLPTLEISNGIPWITKQSLPFHIKYTFILALTSFGGFCAIAQTYSMIHKTKLAIFPYIIQKLITSMVTSLLAICYIYFIHQ